MKLVNVGFGNTVAADRVITVASPESAPIKRIIAEAKDENRAIDITCGRKTKCVIICDSGHVVLSSLTAETVTARINESSEESDEDDAE